MAMQGQGFPWQQMMQQQMPQMQQRMPQANIDPKMAMQQQAVATAPQMQQRMPPEALQRMQQAMQQRMQPQQQMPQQQMPFPGMAGGPAAPTGATPYPEAPQGPMQGFNPFLGAYSSNFRQNVPNMQLPSPGFGYQGFYNIPGVTPPPTGETGREPAPQAVQTRRRIGGGGGGQWYGRPAERPANMTQGR